MTTKSTERMQRFRSDKAVAHRLKRQRFESLRKTGQTHEDGPSPSACVDCGWGRLIFAQTFDDAGELAAALREEAPEHRDIAVYVGDPHVLLAEAPQEIFLDPSHTFRLELSTYRSGRKQPRGFFVRRLTSEADARAVNRIYASRGMVPVRRISSGRTATTEPSPIWWPKTNRPAK